jgi:hypothetical protein
MPLASSALFHLLLCFVYVAFVPGQRGHAYIVGGDDPSAGGSRHCGGCPRRDGTCCRNLYLGGYCGTGQRRTSRKGCGRPGTPAEREALERVFRVGIENAAVLASAHEDAKGFVQKITQLEGEHAAKHRAQDVSEREC